MSGTEYTWVEHPEVITHAIRMLAGAVTLLGGALVSVILYVWHQHKKSSEQAIEAIKTDFLHMSDSLKIEISKVADNLEKITETLFDRQNELARKVVEIETRCNERHK